MRILFVATGLPVPATNGQRIRTLSMARALAALGHEVTYTAFAPATMPASLEPLNALCRGIDLEPEGGGLVNLSERGDYARRLGCLLRRRSYSLERFRAAAMEARIARNLRTLEPDLVWCDSVWALGNVPRTNVPILLNSHNVEHLIMRRYAEVDPNPLRRCYARMEGRALGNAERAACGRAAVMLACSDQDQAMLRQMRPALPVFVAPNVVDTEALGGMSPPASSPEAPSLLFQGAMDWFPNRDAVEFFAKQILPCVQTQLPRVRFVIAGRNPPESLRQRLGSWPGIEFTGTVPDMRPYLAAATLVVVPLRFGSGTRIKILEACAAGRAVVSSRVGAEGLELRDGDGIVLADEPAAFVQAVVALARDAKRRQAIADAGRKTVLERYSPAALQSRLAGALASIPPCRPAASTEEVGVSCH